jgi:hypothetical protein
MLKKEYSYTFTPLLGLRGLFEGELYLLPPLVGARQFSIVTRTTGKSRYDFRQGKKFSPLLKRADRLLRGPAYPQLNGLWDLFSSGINLAQS